MIAVVEGGAVSTEIEVAGQAPSPTLLEQAHAVEHDVLVASLKMSMIAIPICVAIWVGIVSIGLAMAGSGNFLVALPMAGGVGIVAGAFFGIWAAFLAKAHQFEELDRKAAQRR
jgi:hypothetical protein